MKNFLNYLLSAILVFAVAVGVTGCSKDEKDDDTSKSSVSSIVGKMFVHEDSEDCHLVTGEKYCWYYVELMKFNADGIAEYWIADWDGYELVIKPYQDLKATYKVDGNHITCYTTYEGYPETYTEEYRIETSNGKIILVDLEEEEERYEYKEVKASSPEEAMTPLMNKHKVHPHEEIR